MSKGTNLLGLSFVLSDLTSSNPFVSLQPTALIGHTNIFKYIGIYRDGDMTYRLKIVFPNQGIDGGDINILFPYEWLYTNYGVE